MKVTQACSKYYYLFCRKYRLEVNIIIYYEDNTGL